MEDLFRLDGKVALVTGGAGGIGRALALGLSQYGARVVVASRNREAIGKAAQEIQAETGNQTLAVPVDVTDENSVGDLVKSVVAQAGTIDILVNAMGLNLKRDAFDFPMEDWNRLFNVNVQGTMIACKHVGRIFKEKKQGKIVNLSSIRGIRGLGGGNVGYSATKAAVELITKCLAIEWAPYNIHVNALGPSLIITPGTIHIQNDPARAETYRKQVPLGRLGFPEDVIGACVFLASKASDFLTGQTIYVDGGLVAK
ncbi:MAG TPA: glucose 1-dehydrogenase [Patescibacteria group bacterium]|nr:glucose 1-dehydrogenase [Patescibacteria group bacterium]